MQLLKLDATETDDGSRAALRPSELRNLREHRQEYFPSYAIRPPSPVHTAQQIVASDSTATATKATKMTPMERLRLKTQQMISKQVCGCA